VFEQAQSWSHATRIVATQMRAGFSAIKNTRLLQVAVLLGFSLNLVVAPIQVLLPLFVRDVKHADASYFGLLVGCLLIGLITGSLAAPSLSRRFGLGHMTILAVSALGGLIMVASWPPTLWPPAFAMLLAGICIGSLNVAQTTLLQDFTSDDERGRVSAFYYTATLGVRPAAFLTMGALAEAVDIRWLFVVLGVMCLLVGGVLAREPDVRDHR
jgi:MFS family permease